MQVQYRMSLVLPQEIAKAWELYKEANPQQSFNGLVNDLLKEHLCASDAKTLTSP